MAANCTLNVRVPFGAMTVPFAGAPLRVKFAALVPSIVTLLIVSEVTVDVFVIVNVFVPAPV